MLKIPYLSVALVALCLYVGFVQLSAQTLNFSFRISSTTYGSYPTNWNFVTGYGSSPGTVGLNGETAGATLSNLIDSNGNNTGFTITMGSVPFNNAANFGSTGFTPTQNFGYPESAAEGLMSGPSNSSFILSNLDPTKTYTFTFYGSLNQYVNADSTTYNGWATDNVTYTASGETSGSATIDVSHNQSQLATISGIIPNSNGQITINAPLINVMTVTETQPQTLNFSFRISSTYYGSYPANWNFVTGYGQNTAGTVGLNGEGAGATLANLIDSNGNNTGINITMGSVPFNNAANFGSTGFTPTQDFGYPESAAEGVMSGPSNTTFKLSNLDQTKIYSFTFYGSLNQYVNADSTTYNGWAVDNVTYTATGQNSGSATLDISHNQSQLGVVNNIIPDSSGSITINAPFINVMTMTKSAAIGQSAPQMFGVNLAGADFGSNVPGVYGTDYTYPTDAEFAYYQGKGLTFIRIPFLWERIQHSLNATLDPTELSHLDAVVGYAHNRGMKILLDIHNYNYYQISGTSYQVGSTQVPYSALQNLWSQLATHYAHETAVYGYDLMNEPQGTLANWQPEAQAVVNTIRQVDTTHYVFVEGVNYSGAQSWASSNSTLQVTDPANLLVYSAHSYWDSSFSGNYGVNEQGTASTGVNDVQPFVSWIVAHGYNGHIGEYGVPNNSNNYTASWETALNGFLAYLKANNISGTYWAGGPWWGTYPLSCEPTNNLTTDSLQMSTLQNYHQ